MDSNDISVLVCDDSALMRNLIGKIVQNAEGLELAGTAMNGRFALEKIKRLKPDIIVLDLEMPEMNGIDFLKERKKLGIEIPVVILSSVAKKGAEITMEALALGAVDFIMKPSDSNTQDLTRIASHIVSTLTAYGHSYRRTAQSAKRSPSAAPSPAKPAEHKAAAGFPASEAAVYRKKSEDRKREFPPADPGRKVTDRIEAVVIGISTGGPNALREVFRDIDPALKVPVLVVQHMPAGFTEEFARSLDRICPLTVKEAADGDVLTPGRILIAPGHAHLAVEKKKLAVIARLQDSEPVNGHRPSADVLFKSAVQAFAGRALGVIMTGMGRDGAREIGSLYNAGAVTIGQDEASSIVYGMPKAAFDAGYIDYQLPLSEIAGRISEIVREKA